MGTTASTLLETYDGENWEINVNCIIPDFQAYQRMCSGKTDAPFRGQNYAVFAFIAGVRNYSCVKPIASGRGLPEDRMSEPEYGWIGQIGTTSRYPYKIEEGHSQTFVTANELLTIDYEEEFEDRRDHSVIGTTVPEGTGKMVTLRDFLGEFYFLELNALREFARPEYVRIVFSFES